MEKSGSQKALKVISIIMIVVSALGILLGILILIGGGAALASLGMDEIASSFSTSDTAIVSMAGIIAAIAGGTVLVSAIFALIAYIFGLRGANDPSKIGVFWVFSIIMVVMSALSVISVIATGGNGDAIASSASTLILPIVDIVLANNIKKQVQ